MKIEEIRDHLKQNVTLSSDAAKRFFKVTEGSYAQNEMFLGITVPAIRTLAKIYHVIDFDIIKELLSSKYNEERLLGLIILVNQYQKRGYESKQAIYEFYMSNLSSVNNWNLVDSSAHHIIGAHLFQKDCSVLLELAGSNNLWKRRIAIIATWYFIRMSELDWTFRIAKLLIKDEQDLIHKAVGWMLREAGKKDEVRLISFLRDNFDLMPGTMRRYAMERLTREQKYSL